MQLIIKKYKNRKLYNSITGKYVTIQELIGLIRENDIELKVIDNSDGKDITKLVLTTMLKHLNLTTTQMISLIEYGVCGNKEDV